MTMQLLFIPPKISIFLDIGWLKSPNLRLLMNESVHVSMRYHSRTFHGGLLQQYFFSIAILYVATGEIKGILKMCVHVHDN